MRGLKLDVTGDSVVRVALVADAARWGGVDEPHAASAGIATTAVSRPAAIIRFKMHHQFLNVQIDGVNLPDLSGSCASAGATVGRCPSESVPMADAHCDEAC